MMQAINDFRAKSMTAVGLSMTCVETQQFLPGNVFMINSFHKQFVFSKFIHLCEKKQ